MAAANTNFSSGGLASKLGAFCPPQADSVPVDSFVLQHLPLLQPLCKSI